MAALACGCGTAATPAQVGSAACTWSNKPGFFILTHTSVFRAHRTPRNSSAGTGTRLVTVVTAAAAEAATEVEGPLPGDRGALPGSSSGSHCGKDFHFHPKAHPVSLVKSLSCLSV